MSTVYRGKKYLTYAKHDRMCALGTNNLSAAHHMRVIRDSKVRVSLSPALI